MCAHRHTRIPDATRPPYSSELWWKRILTRIPPSVYQFMYSSFDSSSSPAFNLKHLFLFPSRLFTLILIYDSSHPPSIPPPYPAFCHLQPYYYYIRLFVKINRIMSPVIKFIVRKQRLDGAEWKRKQSETSTYYYSHETFYSRGLCNWKFYLLRC